MTTKTKKPKKKKLTAAQKKIRREIQADLRRDTKARRDQWISETTLEQRKQFIGLLHEGKSIGKACEEAFISLNAGLEVFRRNLKKTTLRTLKSVDEVK